MLKNIIATSLVAATLILSGCGDAEGESRLATQNAVDSGNFAAAIAALGATPAADRTASENLTLASAYMGEAGFSFTDVIALMDSDDSVSGASGFESFAEAVDTEKTPETILNIDLAIEAYEAYIAQTTAAPSRTASRVDGLSEVGDAALFLGIAYMTKATVVMTYLGNISELSSGTGADLKDTSDAIKCVYTGSCAGMSFTGTPGPDGVGQILSTNGKDRLANVAGDELILTNYEDNTLAVNADYTITVALLQALNGGFTSILTFAPDEVKDDIREYRAEMDTSGNGIIDAAEMAAYLAD